MQLDSASAAAAAAAAAAAFAASTLVDGKLEGKRRRRRQRRRPRIDDDIEKKKEENSVGHVIICPTDHRSRAALANTTTNTNTTNNTNNTNNTNTSTNNTNTTNTNTTPSNRSIVRTLYLAESLLTLLLLMMLLVSSVPMTTAAPPLLYCHRLDAFPRRLYATKTSYDDVRSLHDNGDVTRVVLARNQTQSDSVSALVMPGCLGYDDVQLLEPPHPPPPPPPHLNATQLNGRMRRCHDDSSKQKTEEERDGCVPGSVYLLARHGTRFNKLTNMNKMTQQLRRIQDLIKVHAAQGSMCKEDLDWLGEWNPRHTINDDSKLSNSGWNELHEIGRRYGELYSDVLRHAYSPSLYEFRYTNYTGKGDRTRQSAKAFAKGLWGDFNNVDMTENSRPDWLLQFYEHCHKYLQIVGSHPVEDYEKFKTGPEMTEVIDDVNKRLGLPKQTLAFPDVYLIFENCRLEHGLHRDAPWCSILTPAMLEVIEYHQDIKYYWEDSYGHPISYEPACTLVRDIIDHLQDETKLGRFRFAHSGTLDALYTRIGLFRDDEPLRANNFARHRWRRRWATSRSTPMAANIVFVKYRCRNPPSVRVKTIVNEDVNRPVTIPGCPPSPALCPLHTLTSLWRPIADDCDIERICQQQQPSATVTNSESATAIASMMKSAT